jgi:type IX secretion system PorP/SprF family membrane protein
MLLCEPAFSQQDPMYTMYMFDKMLINPGYAGSSNWAVGTIKHRDQYMGLSGRPTTQTFNFHTPVQKKHLGIGIKVINDKIAIKTDQSAALLLSYHMNFAGGKLSMGVEGGVFRRSINYQDLVLASRGDNAIPGTSTSALVPDLSAGLYYQRRQFYMGLSNYHLYTTPFSAAVETGADSRLTPHYYFIIGKIFDLGRFWQLEPSLLARYHDSGVFQADANMMLYYDERIGVGVHYRHMDAAAAMIRVHITEGLRIAYSYDMTISPLATYGRASHEIVLSYGIKLLPPPVQKEIHPRYYF